MLATLLLLAATTTAEISNEKIATEFAQAIASDDIRSFTRFTDPYELSRRPWRSVRETLERLDCIQVRSVRVVSLGPSGDMQIELDALGTSANSVHEQRMLPSRWILHRKKGSSELLGAATAVEDLVESSRKEGETRNRVAALSRVELRELALVLAREGCQPGDDSCRRLAEIVDEQGVQRADPAVLAAALAALASCDPSLERRMALVDDASRWSALAANPDVDAAVNIVAAKQTTVQADQETLYERVVCAIEELDDPRPALRSLYEIGNSRFERFDLVGAQDAFDHLTALSGKFGWAPGEALGLTGESRVAAANADYELCRRLTREAERVADEQLDFERMARAFNTRAQSLLAVNRDSEALPIFERALAIAPPEAKETRSILLTNIGWSLYRLGRFEEAAKYVEPAMIESRPFKNYSWAAYMLASTMRFHEGRFSEAIAIQREALNRSTSRLWVSWAIRDELATKLEECGDREGAIEERTHSVDAIEARRTLVPGSQMGRVRYFSQYLSVYERLIDLLIDAHRTEEALLLSEKMRARVLADTLYSEIDEPSLTESERKRAALLERDVQILNRSIQSDRHASAVHANELAAARSRLDEFRSEVAQRQVSPAATPDMETILSVPSTVADHATIEYTYLGSTIAAFVIRRGNVDVVRLPGSRELLAANVKRFQHALSTRSLRYEEAGRTVYDTLIAPLTGKLAGVTHLTLVPSGSIWNVAFEALASPARKTLDEQFTIDYVPSLAILAELRHPHLKKPQRELLALGNPSLARSSQPPSTGGWVTGLPEAAAEVNAIGTLFPADRRTVLVDREATESTFKAIAGEYRVIHVASHAVAEPSAPLYSALYLYAGDHGDEDGRLEAREIARMRLSADVAVLAACETATGSIDEGEGTIGLAWAFLASGCSTTVASRWKTPSRATTLLMVTFHRSLLQNGSPSVALREARTALRRHPEYKHPFYWASFATIGRP